ncbi:MAG: hypothetical protein SNJ73_06900 [Acetobacteraceae bacterium]
MSRALALVLLVAVSACAGPPREVGRAPPEIERACRAEAERVMAGRMRATEGRMDEMAGRLGETAPMVEQQRSLDWLSRERLYRECVERTVAAGRGGEGRAAPSPPR